MTKRTYKTADEIGAEIIAKLYAKCQGWNEEYCWHFLRQVLPHAVVEQLAWFADRIQLEMQG